jgi:hypothetical protein
MPAKERYTQLAKEISGPSDSKNGSDAGRASMQASALCCDDENCKPQPGTHATNRHRTTTDSAVQLRIQRYKAVAEHAVTGSALGHTAHTISRQGESGYKRTRLLLFEGGNVTGGGGGGRTAHLHEQKDAPIGWGHRSHDPRWSSRVLAAAPSRNHSLTLRGQRGPALQHP